MCTDTLSIDFGGKQQFLCLPFVDVVNNIKEFLFGTCQG